MIKKISIVILFIACICFMSNCRKCKKGDTRINQDVADTVKKTLFQFPVNTRWVFKSNTGDLDTAFLGAAIYSYDNGNCVNDDCCEMQYVQSANQKINYQVGTDGLDKFTEFYVPRHALVSHGITFTFSTDNNFISYYTSNLTVNSSSLNDVSISTHNGPVMGDIYVDIAYWSLSKGLVRYDYQQTNGSYISYERQDL